MNDPLRRHIHHHQASKMCTSILEVWVLPLLITTTTILNKAKVTRSNKQINEGKTIESPIRSLNNILRCSLRPLFEQETARLAIIEKVIKTPAFTFSRYFSLYFTIYRSGFSIKPYISLSSGDTVK